MEYMIEKENISPCVKLGCSACCRDVSIRLYSDEARFLEQAGTTLMKQIDIPLGGWGSGGDGRGEYHLKGSCGYLGNNELCQVYHDARRPKACSQLQPGPGFLGLNGCNGIRRGNYLPVLRRDGTIKNEKR